MNALALTGLSNETKIEVTEKFLRRRNEALAEAKEITAITTRSGQDSAVGVLSDLKALRTGVESGRKEIKQPVLDLGKRIDETAADAVRRIMEEEGRIKALLEGFLLAQRQQAERERQEAIAKAEREAEEARAAVEETERKRREAEEKANRLKTPVAIAKAEAEAERLGSEVNRLDVAAEEANRIAESTAAVLTEPAKPFGASAREVWDYEVVDVQLLAAQRPALVTIMPKRSDILGVLKASNGAPIAGLKVISRVAVSVR